MLECRPAAIADGAGVMVTGVIGSSGSGTLDRALNALCTRLAVHLRYSEPGYGARGHDERFSGAARPCPAELLAGHGLILQKPLAHLLSS